MSDRRQKNVNWQLNVDSLGRVSNEDAHLAVLMDLREELQRLNQILMCPNFLAIPRKLDAICHNTKKKKRKTRVKK